MGKRIETDIVVIGAGPAGLGFARVMAGSGLRLTLIERQPRAVLDNPPEDGRDIALTHTSEEKMRALGIWDHIPADKIGLIRDARVINGTDPYALRFDAAETGAPYLGRIVPNHLIRRATWASVKDDPAVTVLAGRSVTHVETDAIAGKVTLDDGTEITAPLIVAADSRMSETRRRMGIAAQMSAFGRTVIVCAMTHELRHDENARGSLHHHRTLPIPPTAGPQRAGWVRRRRC